MVWADFKDLCLDARDPLLLGRFWAAALGLELETLDDGDVVLRGPTPQHTVRVDAVPEPKTVKNRMHLDVHAGSVQELLDLGASVVGEQPRWTVMADPEGGEFCAFVREAPPPYRLHEVILDCADPRAVATWWAELLGGRFVDEGKDWCWVAGIPGAPFEALVANPVPEPKSAKNRVHLDLVGDPARIVAHGATVVGEHPRWTVLADPEGNEFGVFPRALPQGVDLRP
jgi:catechol 2,3-dioxygenase-like lactoylglutathione lyase family enzyme